MSTRDSAIIFVLIGVIITFCGCATYRFPNLRVAEAKMVRDCQYLDTISETSDPGKFARNSQYDEFYDGEMKVLERASNMEATHIVWMYNHPIGSAASAYRCSK